MKKAEFLSAIANKTGATLKATTAFYNAYVETVKEAMAKDDKIVLVGFGTYEAKKKPARTCTNPSRCNPTCRLYGNWLGYEKHNTY